MKKYQIFFKEDYGFIPNTFILPEDIKAYKRFLDTENNPILLAKPSKGRGGQGIFFVKSYKDLDQESMSDYEYVAQHYIPNPFLIDKKKFDFRLYLMIKGVENMEAYIASEGMVRFCTEEYVDPEPKGEPNSDEDGDLILNFEEKKDNLMGHLTNYCLNKESKKYVNNNNFHEADNGTKRLLTNVLKVIESMGVDLTKFNENVKDICTKLVIALRPHIVNTYHYEIGLEGKANQNCFHILGLDLMLDEDHKLWVLEINCFPSFNYFCNQIIIDEKTKKRIKIKQVSELDKHIKTMIVKGAVQIMRGEEGGDKSEGVFKQVYPPKDKEKYGKYSVYDDIRKAFERLAYPQKPDFLNLSQFEAISEIGEEHKLEELTNKNLPKSLSNNKPSALKNFNAKLLTRSLLRNSYKQFAKCGNKSLMNLTQFTKAIDGLAKTLYPAFYTKYERMSRIVEEIFSQ